MPRTSVGLLLPLVSVFLGCQGADHVIKSHYRLDTAYDMNSKGQYAESIDLLERLLVDVDARKAEYTLQRFYAYYLLTQATLLQALDESTEASQIAGRTTRVNPRVLRAMLYLGAALDLADAASATKPVSASGQRLIPGRLEAIAIEDIETHLDLLVVGFYGGLRFRDKMQVRIGRLKRLVDLTKLESCETVFDRVGIIAGVRPWVALALHRYLRRTNPGESFRFAIRALHDEKSNFDSLTRDEVVTWIDSGAKFEFKCNKCDRKVVPDRPKCFNCGESYLSAYTVERPKA